MVSSEKEKEHFERLNKYFARSRWKYNFFLGGSKHFGFYPDEKWLPTEDAQRLMQDLVAEKIDLTAGMRILDAGCGQGVTSTYLAEKYGAVVEGITVVPFEIGEANTLSQKLGVSSRVHYSLMDYSKLKFDDEYFDAVYTQESLVHSTDTEQTLREFYRVLKNGGGIALFEYTIANDNKFSSKELKIMNEMIYASAMYNLTYMRHDEFNRLISRIGFQDVRAENISRKVVPMLRFYQKFAKPIYYLVSAFGLAYKTPNLVAAAKMVEFGEKDLVRYNIFTAYK